MTRIRNLVLVGRRWWNKRTSNTYHSVEIIINGVLAQKIHYAFGYGQAWEDTAATWLDANGYMPDRKHYESSGGREDISWYCGRKDIVLYRTCTDVTRRSCL